MVQRSARMPRRWVAPGLALAGLLGACGGGGGGSAAGGASPSPSASAAVVGPEEFGLTMEELALRVEQVEAAVRDCMTTAGFEYVPVDFATVKAAMDSDKTAPGVSEEDFVAQFGYGITTSFDDPVVEAGKGEQNVAIFAALPAPDQAAYSRALWGDRPDVTLARALEDEDFAGTGGCTRSAAEQSFSSEELTGTYINPGDVLLEQDPRVVAALEEWATCVRDAGYEYGHPDEVEEDLSQQLDEVLAGADPASLTGPAQAALTELQGYERAVAGVATGCEEEHVQPVVEQVESEVYGAPQG